MAEFDAQTYWEKRLQKSFGLQGVGLIGMGKFYNNWLYRIRRSVFLKKVSEFRDDFSNSKALDVGCGSGFYIERWKELNIGSLVGIDITKIAIDELAARHPGYLFYQMDISEEVLPIIDMQFDFISAFDVLFHIVDDSKFEKAVYNIYLLLKPGGLLLWSDNFLHGQTLRAKHQVCRSLADIEIVLRNTGFTILQRSPMFYLMNAPIDCPSHGMKIFWKILKSTVSRSEALGALAGALLYPIELFLVSINRESPTTEIMICKK